MAKPILEVVNEIKMAIDKNPLSRKKLHTLVPGIYLSRNTIQPTFKKIIGVSVSQYRLQKRMETAADFMAADQYISIQEVAYKCGYKGRTGASNFSRDFKKIYKKTPKQWQAVNTASVSNRYNSEAGMQM